MCMYIRVHKYNHISGKHVLKSETISAFTQRHFRPHSSQVRIVNQGFQSWVPTATNIGPLSLTPENHHEKVYQILKELSEVI